MADSDAQLDWIRRSSTASAEAKTAFEAPDPEAGRHTVVTILDLVLVGAVLAALSMPQLLLVQQDSLRGGYETGWRTVGVATGGGLGHRVLFDLVLLVPLAIFSVLDLWRVRTGRRVRWESPRTALGVAFLGWSATLALSADYAATWSMTTPASFAVLLLAMALALSLVVRRDLSTPRLVAIGAVLLASAFSLSVLADVDDPTRATSCKVGAISGFSQGRCMDTVHAGLVWGVAIASVVWVGAAVTFFVAARRNRAKGSAGGLGRALHVAAAAFVVVTVLVSVTSQTAVQRNWCSDVPVVRTFTRPSDCNRALA